LHIDTSQNLACKMEIAKKWVLEILLEFRNNGEKEERLKSI
jgi:hypothetical protein